MAEAEVPALPGVAEDHSANAHSANMHSANDMVSVGRIGPAWGLNGAVFVQPLTDDVEQRFAAGIALLTDPSDRGPLTVAEGKWHGKRFVVHFEGFTDRTAVEVLKGTMLLVNATDRPALEDPDDFYDTELVGLEARSADGLILGEVIDVVHAPGGDYLVLNRAGHEQLVPFVRAIVPEVCPGEGFLVVDGPDGLLDL